LFICMAFDLVYSMPILAYALEHFLVFLSTCGM
jgi:hypothetical protein